MHPGLLNISQFDYQLPNELIAKFPMHERDESRLLVYHNEVILDTIYKSIDVYLPFNSLLITNNTRVVEARLTFTKTSGGIIEVFCLEPAEEYSDFQIAMQQTSAVKWKCLIGGASKWKHGQILKKEINHRKVVIELSATFLLKKNNYFIIQLSWIPSIYSFAEILQHAGEMPLPPYLQRSADITDKERYQTVYAQHSGSVAAPTAGLHFSDKLLKELSQKNITIKEVTLHVGAGTFMPVKTDRLQDHMMHAEWMHVSLDVIKEIRKHLNGNIVATGTTSLRTIESLYWIGVKILKDKFLQEDQLQVAQWEPYKNITEISAERAIDLIISWLNQNNRQELMTKTQIIIAPGYKFRIVNTLITNFHQPRSTLLLLIAAFIGDDWKRVYQYAIENKFRFLSYGDGSLLFRNNSLL